MIQIYRIQHSYSTVHWISGSSLWSLFFRFIWSQWLWQWFQNFRKQKWTTHWCSAMCNHKPPVCELNQTDNEAQKNKQKKGSKWTHPYLKPLNKVSMNDKCFLFCIGCFNKVDFTFGVWSGRFLCVVALVWRDESLWIKTQSEWIQSEQPPAIASIAPLLKMFSQLLTT